jgi:hypothetical protein
MVIVALSGLIEANPDAITFFRLVFHEDFIINE